jgi:hypothetical protein
VPIEHRPAAVARIGRGVGLHERGAAARAQPADDPLDTLFCSVPNAEPMMTISCPGRSDRALPMGITAWDGDGVATLRMAMSNAGARVSTRALTVLPSLLRSVT